MDQGGVNPSQHEDSNFNLYDTYDADMDDEVALVGGSSGGGGATFGGWGQHHQVHAGEAGYSHETEYDTSTTPMDDFGTAHYGHDFQHAQPFDHDAHQFQDFMVHNDDQHQAGTEGGFDMNSMDLYNTSTIY